MRYLPLVGLIVALSVLEIALGIYRLRQIREERLLQRKQEIATELAALARDLDSELDRQREHAAYLSRSDVVRRALETRLDAAARRDLQRLIAPYLLSFRGIDRIQLLDPEAHELFRAERVGNLSGVAVLPQEALAPEPQEHLAALAARSPPGELARSPLEVDAARVEVAERDRVVVRYATRIATRDRILGLAVLTVYAAPILRTVDRFVPVPGARARLVPARDEAPAGDLHQPLATAPDLELRAQVPEAAVRATMGGLAEEGWWIIGAMVLVTATLGLSAVGAARAGTRELRLRREREDTERRARDLQRYRTLLEGAADMILVLDPGSGALPEANALARETLGLDGSDLAQGARPLDARLDDADRERLEHALREAAAHPGQAAELPELQLRNAEGHPLPVSGRLAALDLDGRRVVQVSLRDLTRQRAIERRLRTVERLGSLGLLTAGVAHEINNPLAGIGNYLGLLGREGLSDEDRARYLERVRHGFDRIRDLVRDLSGLAREKGTMQEVDLVRVVTNALRLSGYARESRDLRVVTEGLDHPRPARGDPGRLEQVFVNLFLNAARAMDGSGTLRVRAEDAADGGLVVHVDDEGPGIPEEDVDHIFDPFFTRSGGSGLGLWVSYGIIDAHGGSLVGGNRPEGGARFTVRLPAGGPST